jgi:hypothetical protein
MATFDSALDPEQMARVRALIAPRRRGERMWPAVGAAAFLAISALAFAAAMLMAPPIVSEHVAVERSVD